MFAIQGILLILTYFDLIQTIELKDRLMIYFAFQRFLADIKLTETFFLFLSNVFALHLFRHSGILIADFQKWMFRNLYKENISTRKIIVKA